MGMVLASSSMWLVLLVFFSFRPANALLSPKGVNYEVQALMMIKNYLKDPHGVLKNWDQDSVDPCSWTMVTCSPENLVTGLSSKSESFWPTLPKHREFDKPSDNNNNINGLIPEDIGKLTKLKTLDLSSNHFSGEIPSSVGHLESLQYLDLSYNNLSGPIPGSLTKTFNIVGNPLICEASTGQDCYRTLPMPMSYSLNDTQGTVMPAKTKSHKIAIVFGATTGCISLLFLAVGLLFWLRHRRTSWHQLTKVTHLFDVTIFATAEQHIENVNLGNMKRYQFRELQAATENFSSKNILGKGGFGIVYRGQLADGTVVAVKRLKDGNAAGGEAQVQTEVEMISLAVHRNLLRLYGFCMTTSERLLVYPYMSNGSVAFRLKEYLSTGQSSEKTDVFGFGILLLELITGQTALEFGKSSNQKGAMLDWVKKMHQEKNLDILVDKGLKSNYDRIELEEMVQVALLCTQYLPGHRPKMSEVVRMLEGDGLAERWEASQNSESHKFKVPEFTFGRCYSDLTDDSSLLVQAVELSGPR
ncbi:hypothetical protein PR202_gb09676 [Eleusine coracana subsp. coracana]|uniref:Protein kinase domain-containing protein n=1 Tax=Eleusine coracana subsp. coracana TaxID=191504 RepID=A0AAV5EFK4_ELECO|nr:hypothetical protein PR202_gb09676 [Eleusine coracana subsp. coracana]